MDLYSVIVPFPYYPQNPKKCFGLEFRILRMQKISRWRDGKMVQDSPHSTGFGV